MGKKGNASNASSLLVLETNLRDATDMLEAQVAAGMPLEKSRDALFAEAKIRIEDSLDQISRANCLALIKCCNAGPWTPEQRLELAHLLSTQTSTKDPENASKQKNQHCLRVENFLKQSEWIIVRNCKIARLQKAQVIANALIRIGCKNPCERTLFRCVQVLAYGEGDWEFNQNLVFSLMSQVQTLVKDAKQKLPLPYVVDYPVAASDLPKEILNMLGGDIPIVLDIRELDQILAGRVMRGRPKFDQNEFEWVKHLPTEELRAQAREDIHKLRQKTSQAPAATTTQSQNIDFDKLLPSHAHHAKTEAKEEDVKHTVKFEQNDINPWIPMDGKLRPPSLFDQSLLYTQSVSVPGSASHQTIASTGTDSLEDMEAKLRLIVPGKVAKRPKNQKKRPASAMVMKRPAAKFSAAALKLNDTIDTTDIFAKLGKLLKTKPITIRRNAFTCRAYKGAHTRCKDAKVGDSVKVEFARMMHNKASAMWSDHFP
jgi:hypothetical protein